LRNIPREGIEAVKRGQDPKGISRKLGETIATYSNQRLFCVSPLSNVEEDRALLREIGRRVAEESLRNPPGLTSAQERDAFKIRIEHGQYTRSLSE
jgi:hypothetical protein